MRLRNSARSLAVLFVAVALSASGCAGGDATGTQSSAQEEKEQELLAFAQCMRDEGIDVPDPKPGEYGLSFTRPAGNFDETEVTRVRDACRQKLGGVFVELTEEETEAQDKLLAFARCMRGEGIDMPDPDLSEGHIGLGEYIRQHADPGDPEYDAADDVCRQEAFGGQDRGPGASGEE